MSESLGSIISVSLESLKPILYSVGIGGIGGFFVGYIVKKILNLAIILGAFALGLLYLAQIKAVDLDFEETIGMISNFGNFFNQFVTPLIASGPFMVSFFLGFLGGMRQG